MPANVVPAKAIPVRIVLPHRRTTEDGVVYYTYSWEKFYDVVGCEPPKRRMLANLGFPQWTEEMVFVQIAMDNGDVHMPEEAFASALKFAEHKASQMLGKPVVFHATQSGYKGGSYAAVSIDVHSLLAQGFDRENGGCDFANYLPLMYSSLSDGPMVDIPAVWEKSKFGHDGNVEADPDVWPYHEQFRGVIFDKMGVPKAVLKGTALPNERTRGDYRGLVMNDTCVKWHNGVTEDDRIIVAPTPVRGKTKKSPVTWEFAQLWKPTEEVLAFFKKRIRKEIKKLMDPIKQARKGNRVPLLKQLGGLKLEEDDITLTVADRSVISAVRSNLPWCKELEDRLGRILVRVITERIIPSGGLFAYSYLAYQHDEVGMVNCEIDGARCIAFRLPLTSMENVVGFSRVARKGVFHSCVLVIMAGDSDGDRVLVLSDKEAVELFKKHHINFNAGLKPNKTRRQEPLTPKFLFDHAVACKVNGAKIGLLTMAQHKLMVAGFDDLAAIAGQAAQAYPMMAKHAPTLNGQPIAIYAKRALDAANQLPTPQWREMQKAAGKCSSPRELRSMRIDEPESIIDHCWNYGSEALAEWHAENPLTHANLVEIADFVFKVHGDFVCTNTEDRWLRTLKVRWGLYWEDWHTEADQGIYSPVGPFIKSLEETGRQASERKLYKLLTWVPASEDSDGFLLKWYVIGKQWEYLLGLHPSVVAYFEKAKKNVKLPEKVIVVEK